MSGGQGYNEPCTEAQAMADYMEAAGIEKDRLILEDESKTTEQNIKTVRNISETEQVLELSQMISICFGRCRSQKDRG